MTTPEHPEAASIIAEMRDLLRSTGLADVDSALFTPLSGGVSCDVVKVEDPAAGRSMVVKRALEKLRVRDDWFANTARNHFEHRYMTVVGNFLPGAVPRVLYADDARGFFCMDWIGDGWTNWKQEMLAGRADPRIAAGAGRVLGEIHRKTWGREDLRSEFETTENFFALRLEPYLIATARRTPALEGEFEREVARIRAERQCLVHGDFSPKNMLCRDGRVVILDCEVAWFGDPAFDVAFLVNHLFLKALSRPEHAGAFLDLATEFLAAYESALDPEQAAPVIAAAAHLLPMLLLARVDGKSPVEYLDKPDHQLIRDTVPGMLADTTAGFDAHADRWKSALAEERFKFRHEPQATEPDPGHAP